MMIRTLFLGTILFFVVGCVSTKLPVTPWPTAVAPPEGDPLERTWGILFEHHFEANYWEEGRNRYAFYVDCSDVGQEVLDTEWYTFVVSAETGSELISTPYLRIAGLSLDPVLPDYIPNNIVLLPSQATIASISLVGMSKDEAGVGMEDCSAEIIINDDDNTLPMTATSVFQP